MTTARKRWPNHVEWARTEAIASAYKGLEAVAPLLADKNCEVSVVRRAALANDAFHRIITALQAVGPKMQAPTE
jgi:hypothetical protein